MPNSLISSAGYVIYLRCTIGYTHTHPTHIHIQTHTHISNKAIKLKNAVWKWPILSDLFNWIINTKQHAGSITSMVITTPPLASFRVCWPMTYIHIEKGLWNNHMLWQTLCAGLVDQTLLVRCKAFMHYVHAPRFSVGIFISRLNYEPNGIC